MQRVLDLVTPTVLPASPIDGQSALIQRLSAIEPRHPHEQTLCLTASRATVGLATWPNRATALNFFPQRPRDRTRTKSGATRISVKAARILPGLPRIRHA